MKKAKKNTKIEKKTLLIMMCTEAETPGGRTRTPDGDEEFQGITSGGQEMEGEYDGDRY